MLCLVMSCLPLAVNPAFSMPCLYSSCFCFESPPPPPAPCRQLRQFMKQPSAMMQNNAVAPSPFSAPPPPPSAHAYARHSSHPNTHYTRLTSTASDTHANGTGVCFLRCWLFICAVLLALVNSRPEATLRGLRGVELKELPTLVTLLIVRFVFR